MKNIHVLSTDKQIKNVGDLVKDKYGDIHIFTKNDGKEYGKTTTKLNIYITSDEEIKEGDWYTNIEEKNGIKNPFYGKLYKANYSIKSVNTDYKHNLKKIILTTDQDLIKDGVQSITDDFLEWFVKNPSCEYIQTTELSLFNGDTGESGHYKYEIIIPKEEPKQEVTLDTIENRIIECLNEAGAKLDSNDFDRLAESIIDYIDEIKRSKKC
jgi:hypothetical protein